LQGLNPSIKHFELLKVRPSPLLVPLTQTGKDARFYARRREDRPSFVTSSACSPSMLASVERNKMRLDAYKILSLQRRKQPV
jgi:hypothetical protein